MKVKVKSFGCKIKTNFMFPKVHIVFVKMNSVDNIWSKYEKNLLIA